MPRIGHGPEARPEGHSFSQPVSHRQFLLANLALQPEPLPRRLRAAPSRLSRAPEFTKASANRQATSAPPPRTAAPRKRALVDQHICGTIAAKRSRSSHRWKRIARFPSRRTAGWRWWRHRWRPGIKADRYPCSIASFPPSAPLHFARQWINSLRTARPNAARSIHAPRSLARSSTSRVTQPTDRFTGSGCSSHPSAAATSCCLPSTASSPHGSRQVARPKPS